MPEQNPDRRCASEHDPQRIALSHLRRDDRGLRSYPGAGEAVGLREYSRFKYGDGAVSKRYAQALAGAVAPALAQVSAPVVVTSSGFGFAPPAAHSLVEPFVSALGRLGVRAGTVRVCRRSVSNGDYASMTLSQRQAAVSHHSLSVHPLPAGALVVAVDDVRVTGVHEEAMDRCLRGGGAAQVLHAYVVDAWEAREHPSTEAVLNASGVRTDAELLMLAGSEAFVPNARFCKRVLGMPRTRMRRFLELGPGWLGQWMESVIALDALDAMEAFREGCRVFRSLTGREAVAVAS